MIFGGQTNFSSDSTKHNINLYPPPSICHKKKTLRLKKQARWTTTYSLPDLQKMTPFEGNGWNYVYKKAHLMIDGQRLELQLCIFWSLPLSFLEIQSNENGIQIIDKAVRYHQRFCFFLSNLFNYWLFPQHQNNLKCSSHFFYIYYWLCIENVLYVFHVVNVRYHQSA